jgi:hypothetical protein
VLHASPSARPAVGESGLTLGITGIVIAYRAETIRGATRRACCSPMMANCSMFRPNGMPEMKTNSTPYVIATSSLLMMAGLAGSSTLKMVLIALAAILAALLFRKWCVNSSDNS